MGVASSLAVLWAGSSAVAGVHLIEEGSTLEVPLNTATGTVVQLPKAVRLVTPTTSVLVERVASQALPAKGSKPQPPAPVLHLRVRVPDGAIPMPELVTFVLADDRAVPVRFVPGGPGADPFAELQLPSAPVFDSRDEAFLSDERELMRRMFADEPFRREEKDEHWEYEEYPELSWHLRRQFRGDGLTGYVFVLENETRQTLTLSASVLAVGRPNRAVLVQLDDDELPACRAVDDKRWCRTVLRLVVRNEGSTPSALKPSHHGDMPFVVKNKGER